MGVTNRGGAAAGVVDAAVITVASDGTLTAERSLAGELGVVSITDGGANAAVTVGLTAGGTALAKLADIAGLSVPGRSANTTGAMAAITAGSDDQVLRRSGTSIGFGTITGNGMVTNTVGNQQLRQGVARSVVGVTGNATANVDDIQAANDGDVLRRSGTTVAFGAVLQSSVTDLEDDLDSKVNLAGTAGGQTINGGTASGDDLTLVSTTDGTKGTIAFGTSGYDEVNNRLGVGTAAPTLNLDVVKTTAAGLVGIRAHNSDTSGWAQIGASAAGAVSSQFQVLSFGSAYSGVGGSNVGIVDSTLLRSNSPGGMTISSQVSGADSIIRLCTNGTTLADSLRLTIDNDGNIAQGAAALATNATNGFVFLGSCAGTPSGVPAGSYSGRTPIVIDSTNNLVYIYSGGNWVNASITAAERAQLATPAASPDISNYRHAVTSAPGTKYYIAGQSNCTALAGLNVGANQMYAAPFVVSQALTVDRIGLRITTGTGAGADNICRLGIYEATSSKNLYPGSLVVDAGTVSTVTTNTSVSVQPTQALTAGKLYWAVMHNKGATVGVAGIPVAGQWPMLGSDFGGTADFGAGLFNDFAYAVLASTFAAGATAANSSVPAIFLKFV